MNKLSEAFAAGKRYVPFLTCGDPSLQATQQEMREAAANGAAVLVLAIPFSDPTAEGPLLQEAIIRALAAGTTTDGVFAMLREMAGESLPPIVLKTYANVVFSYGVERFFDTCAALSVAALMIPDLPYEERDEFAAESASTGVALVTQVAPAPAERLTLLAESAAVALALLPGAVDAAADPRLVSAPSAIAAALRAHSSLPIIGQAQTAADAQTALTYCDAVIVPPALLAARGE